MHCPNCCKLPKLRLPGPAILPPWTRRACFIWARKALTERLKELGRLPPEERRQAGQVINEAKQVLETALAARKTERKRRCWMLGWRARPSM